jgi:hypothetical protein
MNFLLPILLVLALAAYIGLMIATASIDTQPNSIYENDPFYNSDFNSDYEFDFNE